MDRTNLRLTAQHGVGVMKNGGEDIDYPPGRGRHMQPAATRSTWISSDQQCDLAFAHLFFLGGTFFL
jgi:hypothetical protein